MDKNPYGGYPAGATASYQYPPTGAAPQQYGSFNQQPQQYAAAPGQYPPSGQFAPQQQYPQQGYPPQQQQYPPSGQFAPPSQPMTGGPSGATLAVPSGPLAASPSGGVADIPPAVQSMPEGELPAEPTAPPMDLFPKLPGFEGVASAPDGFAAPPPAYEPPPMQQPQRNYRITTSNISEDEARQALLAHVDKQCCWGKGAAQELVFSQIASADAFHYRLESWGEHRSVAWAMEPFKGGPLDGPEYGPVPDIWSIAVPGPAAFNNHTVAVEVPHTASMRPCYKCGAQGYVRCPSCFGRGSDMCISCNGSGIKVGVHAHHHHHHHHHHGSSARYHDTSFHASAEVCFFCKGTGRRVCTRCHGRRVVVCTLCSGFRMLKVYLKLTVKWTNHVTDSVVDDSGLPSENTANAQGDVAVQEEGVRVYPIMGFLPRVDASSTALVNQHAQAFPTERVLKQRQTVRVVPVSKASYVFKGKTLEFWVYGHERSVFSPNYPHTCLCCNIL